MPLNPVEAGLPICARVNPSVTASPAAAKTAVIHFLPLGMNRSANRSAQAQTVRMVSGRMVWKSISWGIGLLGNW